MTTQNFTQVRETEKAILFIVGFKFDENRQIVDYMVNGEQKNNTGYLVESWIPKSVISEDGKIADWFCKNIYNALGRFQPIMGDVIF